MDMDIDGINSEKIAILDAGAQYSKLIDRCQQNNVIQFRLDNTKHYNYLLGECGS